MRKQRIASVNFKLMLGNGGTGTIFLDRGQLRRQGIASE